MKTKGEPKWWKPSEDWSLRSLLAVIVVLVLMAILVPLIAYRSAGTVYHR